MKKYFLIYLISTILLLLISLACSEEENPVTPLKGSIFVDSSPESAQIWLNGENTSLVTPNTIKDLTPGSYFVTLKVQNYNDTTFSVNVEENKLTSVSITLRSSYGSIYVSSNPDGAEIWLDGISTSKLTPGTISGLLAGEYSVTLKLQNYIDTTFNVQVNAGQQTSKNIILKPLATLGNIYISSVPAGAQIWVEGVNTIQVTPDTVNNIEEGIWSVTLRLQDYKDTTFSVSVTAGQTSIVGPIVLVSNIITTMFGPVKIYETSGTTVNQPAGLELSSGMVYGISSPQANLIDIYYYSDGTGTTYLIQSANLHAGLIRETDFYIGNGTNLFDGVDSPLRNTGSWTNNMNDREDNYVFLYDHDGHYSKLKIVMWGGGTPGNPAWVEVQWYYNETALDNRF